MLLHRQWIYRLWDLPHLLPESLSSSAKRPKRKAVPLPHIVPMLKMNGSTPPPPNTLSRSSRDKNFFDRQLLESSWNVMAHRDAREGKWRGNWRMEWVAGNLHTTSEHGVCNREQCPAVWKTAGHCATSSVQHPTIELLARLTHRRQ